VLKRRPKAYGRLKVPRAEARAQATAPKKKNVRKPA